LRTRRRHGLPPQPLTWFRTLCECLGNRLKIRVASKGGRPIASMITLAFRDTMIYKYGSSDAEFHNLGGMSFLMWRAIQDAKGSGLTRFDLGRSDRANISLIAFKERWGSSKSLLPYYVFPSGAHTSTQPTWERWLVQKACSALPDSLLAPLGATLYKHVG